MSNTNFNIGIVDAEVMATIALPQEKSLFTASLFINSDKSISDDDLELSKRIDQRLRDIGTGAADAPIVFAAAAQSAEA